MNVLYLFINTDLIFFSFIGIFCNYHERLYFLFSHIIYTMFPFLLQKQQKKYGYGVMIYHNTNYEYYHV